MNLQTFLAAAFLGLVTAAGFLGGYSIYSQWKNEQVLAQVSAIVSGTHELFFRAGSDAIADLEDVVEAGFLPNDQYTDGVGEAVGGGNITVAGDATNNDIDFTFDTGDLTICNYINASKSQLLHIPGSATCNAAGVFAGNIVR